MYNDANFARFQCNKAITVITHVAEWNRKLILPDILRSISNFPSFCQLNESMWKAIDFIIEMRTDAYAFDKCVCLSLNELCENNILHLYPQLRQRNKISPSLFNWGRRKRLGSVQALHRYYILNYYYRKVKHGQVNYTWVIKQNIRCQYTRCAFQHFDLKGHRCIVPLLEQKTETIIHLPWTGLYSNMG